MKNTDRPKCGCGNTQDSNGYCDGSHQNKKNKTCIKTQRKFKKALNSIRAFYNFNPSKLLFIVSIFATASASF